MISDHAPLWGRLQAFDLDDPASPLPFTRRLARENRWTLGHARRVVEEYKRFAMLAVVAGHPVTPSDAVDQAWHLHLVYTRSYWDEFCGEVLRTPLHHGPTRGGASESAKYHDWYARTLESYARVFGEPPPADIWPPADVRFGHDLRFVRVNEASHWIIPRPRVPVAAVATLLLRAVRGLGRRGRRVARIAASVAGLSLLAVGTAGCIGPGGVGDLSLMTGEQFLLFFVYASLLTLIGSVALRLALQSWLATWDGSDPDMDDAPWKAGKLDPYEATLLLNGPRRETLTNVALMKLAGRDEVTVESSRRPWVSLGPSAGSSPPDAIESVVLEALEGGPMKLRLLALEVGRSPAADQVERRLRDSGCLIPSGRGALIRCLPALLIGLLIALSVWRIAVGIERGRAVGFLEGGCGFLAFCALLHLLATPWSSARGDRELAALRRAVESTPDASQPIAAALAFAVLGSAALPNEPAYEGLRVAFTSPGASGGCGAHCGSDGGCGGGGCGGCGGCGG